MERQEAPYRAEERATLVSWLDYQRSTLAWKCEGLTAEQLRERAVPPSSLSLLGLVRHMADVERSWFRRTLTGEDAPPLYWSDDEPDGDFDLVDDADTDEAFATWHEECAVARERQAAAESLDTAGLHRRSGEMISLRWIMIHMIEEYARHLGHADIMREAIDGQTGD
jgi:uncharacterized damage-inducible protein DinB